jgi:hypothetical protein
MPFRSEAQRRYLYSQEPEVAKKWRKKYGPQTNLPERVAKKKKGLLNAYKEGGKKMGRS